MATTLKIGDLAVEVTQKNIKNLHLSVHPPLGRVTVAAPLHLSIKAIRAFAIGKLSWIRQQQQKLQGQERETPREYLERESHYVWGRRCLLRVVEREAPPSVEWRHNRLILAVRPGMEDSRRGEVLEAWYRDQVRGEAQRLTAEWERRLGVRAGRVFIQRMKTRWGSCNPASRAIGLNTDLAKKPRECLEYILVHELAHLLEPTHNAKFVALMDQFLPGWTHRRDQLNRLPVRHLNWTY
jgi:predicted metal-dependent hydrolase